MPCSHKFFGRENHLAGENGLLPNWEADTLIIGTFNPSNDWVEDNEANYFYGRESNYFWDILPRFADGANIDKQDVLAQLDFLRTKRIALTDLLVTVNDAEIENDEHRNFLIDFQDAGFNNFASFTWNTIPILEFIKNKKVKAVYFTKVSEGAPFGRQIRIIKKFCNLHNVRNYKLHTPSGQRLGYGMPRENKLIHRWFEQGGNQFPFLCPNFDINSHDFAWHVY